MSTQRPHGKRVVQAIRERAGRGSMRQRHVQKYTQVYYIVRIMSTSGMFDTQDHLVRDQSLGRVRAELAVSVVATSRRKTGLWTDDKTILGWHIGIKQACLSDHV